MKKAALVLSDGKVFWGTGFGSPKTLDTASVGEVVFNTSMFGYQEIMTDPSYAGQIMTFCYPQIGNVGCNSLDVESDAVHVQGVLIRNLPKRVSNYRAEETLDEYLSRHNIFGLADIDTRMLVRHLRDHGAQAGAMAVIEPGQEGELQAVAKSFGSMEGKDYVGQVSCTESYSWNELPWDPEKNIYPKIPHASLWQRPHIVAVDCGIKYNILRLLLQTGFRITVVPSTSTAEEIQALQPDGVFLSNGPGDPATLQPLVKMVEEIVGRIPIFGICLGHQILAQVLGGKTFKLKFGHRGANHPVMDLATKKVEVSTQNHGFAVDAESVSKELISHLNLNDQTVAGLSCPQKRCFSVQYHPESSAGPHDSQYLFGRFYELVLGGSLS